MRIGLAGVGRIGIFHAETLRDLSGVDALVIADIDARRAYEVAAKLGVEQAPTIHALFEADLDGVVIATATDSHPELIVRSVAAGIPVFCEKPVAADIAGTMEVIQRIEGSGVPVQIGFQRRFDAGYTAAREAVTSGRLGWLHTLRATTLDPAPPPAEYVARSGGLFRDCSVHDFDIIRWVTGREIVEVCAVGANRGEKFFSEAGDVDTAAAVLTLDDGSLALVSASRYNAAGYDVRLEVHGSAGTIGVGIDDGVPMTSAEPGTTWPAGPAQRDFVSRFRPAYTRELAEFVEVAARRTQSRCSVSDALEAFYVAEACELSRREHRAVQLTEIREPAIEPSSR